MSLWKFFDFPVFDNEISNLVYSRLYVGGGGFFLIVQCLHNNKLDFSQHFEYRTDACLPVGLWISLRSTSAVENANKIEFHKQGNGWVTW